MNKNYISALVILISVLYHFCFAQVNDSLIQLTPEIGDTIDLSERSHYGLYPNIEGFNHALLYIRDDTIAVSKVVYQNVDGKSEELVIRNNVVYIGNLRAHIRQVDSGELEPKLRLEELKNIEGFEKITETLSLVTITTKDGSKCTGWLLSVEQNEIEIIPDAISYENTKDILNNTLTFGAEETQSVFIKSEENVGSSLAIGALVGITIGVVAGLSSGDETDGFYRVSSGDKAVASGMILGLAGGLVGLIVGLTTSTPEETIEINSAGDLEKLKEYIVQ